MKPKTKRDMAAFESVDAANKALEAFYAAVGAARQEFGIHDVVLISKVEAVQSSGAIADAQTQSSWGDHLHALTMVAQAYGQLFAEYQAHLTTLRASRSIRGGEVSE